MNIGFDIPEGANGVVVMPRLGSDHDHAHDHDPGEILGLCNTLDYRVCKVFNQNLQRPNPTYFIGKGKVMEIRDFLSEQTSGPEKHEQQGKNRKNARQGRQRRQGRQDQQHQQEHLEFAVFDCLLKPNQVFNLENALHVRVIDRNTLILMIFLHHARTNEAKLQVEYAILKHQIPFVTELVRRSKLGEHPGFMAGGEYKVEEYHRLTKRRIMKIRTELVKIKVSREQRRKHRRKSGFQLLAIAGYTNAGKSALLNALTKARVFEDARMFSTVGTRSRRFRDSKVILTDTVGFIRNIPTQLIEAFKSTLEEIVDADRIILVADIAEDAAVIKNKILTCLSTIDQLINENLVIRSESPHIQESLKRPRFYMVFNKTDLIENAAEKAASIVEDLKNELLAYDLDKEFLISCKTKAGVEELIEAIR